MANGLQTVDWLSGGLDTAPLQQVPIDTTGANWFLLTGAGGAGGATATTVGRGDAVTWSNANNGMIVKTGFQTAGGGAVTGSEILGIFSGCSYQTPTGAFVTANSFTVGTPILAGTFPVALISLDPSVIVNVQTVTTNTAAAGGGLPAVPNQSWVGGNISLWIGEINPMTGSSTMGIDSTLTNTATYGQLRVEGLAQLPNNTWTTAGAILRCSINRQYNAALTAGR